MKYKIPTILFLCAFIVAACAPQATVTPIAAPSSTATVIPTKTPTRIPSPTLVPTESPITDWAEYGHKVGQEAMAKAGINVDSYISKVPAEVAEADKKEAAYKLAWQDFLAQGIEKDPLNSDKVRQYGYSESEPCSYASSPAILLGYSEGEVESEYLKSKGIIREVRGIWAIPDTIVEAQSLVGVYLTDGTYVPFMGLEVGSGAQDFSQDRKLDRPEDLDSLIGKVRVIKVWNKLLNSKYTDWKDPSTMWGGLEGDSFMRESFLVKRSAQEREVMGNIVYDPNGYLYTWSKDNILRKKPLDAVWDDPNDGGENSVATSVYNVQRGGNGVEETILITVVGSDPYATIVR
jgi:hypothetical protein